MTKALEVFQVEVRVADLNRAVAFYREIFAWTIYPSSPVYALVDAGALPVIGLLQDPRLPLGVCPNILAEDCDAMATKAKELGGGIVITRSEVGDTGAFTGTLDPWGTELFFWQPYSEARPRLKAEPENPIVFLEISVPGLDEATRYYSELLGWSFWNVAFADNYAIAEGCGLPRGVGLYQEPTGMAASTCFVKVADVEETAAKVTAAGGQIVIEPTDFPGEGRYIVLADPDGNRLGALQTD